MRDAPMTPAQRRAIFQAAKQRGLELDDIRALTPAGSVSMLTKDQAMALITRLKNTAGNARPRRRPAGTIRFITDAQRDKLTAIRMELGWTFDEAREWLSKRHFRGDESRSMECVLDESAAVSSNDAGEVIELWKHVLTRKAHYAQKGASVVGDKVPF